MMKPKTKLLLLKTAKTLERLSDELATKCDTEEQSKAYQIVAMAMFQIWDIIDSKWRYKCPKCHKKLKQKGKYDYYCPCTKGLSYSIG